jgi:hypothetical protein
MITKRKFTAQVDGKEKTYRAGDKIDADTAKKLGLDNKPNLAVASSAKKTEE